MKKLNDRGFAISAILYTMLVLTVLLMFLIVGLLANRRATLNKMSSEVRKQIEDRKILLYDVLKRGSSGTLSNLSDLTPGIYEGEEDGDKIYYYRGAVNNNYVIFADSCWRIMRTTPDEGVKLIYSGIIGQNNSCNNQSTIAMNIQTYGSNAIYNGPIAYDVLSWYQNQTRLSLYVEQLEKTEFCNDTTSISWKSLNTATNFTCPSGGIRYENYIGIPTVMEVVFAGGSASTSSDYYLHTSRDFVTMSQGSTSTNIAYVDANGLITEKATSNQFSVRPVIALKKGTTYSSGTGTIENPYIIEK